MAEPLLQAQIDIDAPVDNGVASWSPTSNGCRSGVRNAG